jgi:ribosomal protein L37AE/L43A
VSLENDVARAIARLEKDAGYPLTCPVCGHTDRAPLDPVQSVLTCDECGTRIAFGSESPKIFVTAHVDRRFLVSRFTTGKGDAPTTDVSVILDREYATGYAMDLLSVSAPTVYRALGVALAALGNPGSGGTDVSGSCGLPRTRCCGSRSVRAPGTRRCSAASPLRR